MKIIILIIIGIIGGTFGGMGMGGGTLLIPLLTTFGDVSQHAAQSINLAAFLPMAVVALIIHFVKKRVVPKYALLIAIPAMITAIPSAILAIRFEGHILARCFGGFLVVLGVWQMYRVIKIKRITNNE
ncbi:MAG: TSUP family transporter [Firmicutes bacterium]|nr:TSUP family transporter [Bacillota bacterium]